MGLKHFIRCTASAMVLIGLSAGASAAYAQDEDAVGELIVTAQKREQRLQDVPIVVTVVGEQLLEDAGVKDIRDLSLLTPGLTVTSTGSEASVTARIRGIGTVGDNPGLESSVGVVIDGVYRPRNGVGFGDLGDVSRIEVLKGPQGTLFGKNTSAGVINVITNEPSFTPGVEVEATAGNFDAAGLSVNLTGPLAEDKLAGSVFAVLRERDGFLDVVELGSAAPNQTNDQKYYAIRGQLLALPDERLSARLIGDFANRNEMCCAAPQLFVGSATGNRGNVVNATKPGSIDLTGTEFNRKAYADRAYLQDITDMGLSGEVNYDLQDNMRLTSITAWRKWKAKLGSDTDYTAADIFYAPNDGSNRNQFAQLSQEVRLAGENGKLNWLAGFFAAKEDLDSNQALNYGVDFYGYLDSRVLSGLPALIGGPAVVHVPGFARIDVHNQEDRTYAFFTNNDYAVTDAFTVTLGLRYTQDKKEVTSRFKTFSESCQRAETALTPQAALGGVPLAAVASVVGGLCVPFMNADYDALGALAQKLDDNDTSGTFKLAYRWAPTFMTYVSASRGYKSGGVNLDRETAFCPANGAAITSTTHSACPSSAPTKATLNGRTYLKPGGVSTTGRAFGSWVADTDTTFAPETVESYEAGVKSQWFEKTLSVNVSAFDQKYTNFQLNTFVSPAFIVTTIPTVRSKGVDADVYWKTPIDGFSLQGGGSIADTIIGRFTSSQFANFSDYQSIAHLQDRRLSFAPKYTASLSGSYEASLNADYTLRASVSAKYNSAYNTGSDLAPLKIQEEFTVVNARLGIGTADDKWRVELWGQNVFDQDYIQVGFNGPFMVTGNAVPIGTDPSFLNSTTSVYDAFLGAPRTFGLTLRSKLK